MDNLISICDDYKKTIKVIYDNTYLPLDIIEHIIIVYDGKKYRLDKKKLVGIVLKLKSTFNWDGRRCIRCGRFGSIQICLCCGEFCMKADFSTISHRRLVCLHCIKTVLPYKNSKRVCIAVLIQCKYNECMNFANPLPNKQMYTCNACRKRDYQVSRYFCSHSDIFKSKFFYSCI